MKCIWPDLPITDPLERRQAPVLLMLLPLMFVTALLRLMFFFTFDQASIGTTLTGVIAMIALVSPAIALLLLLRGHFSSAALLTALSILLAVVLAITASGLRRSGMLPLVFALPIVITGLMLGWRSLALVCALSCAAVIGIAVLESQRSPLVAYTPSPEFPASMATIFVVVVALLLSILAWFRHNFRHELAGRLQTEQALRQSEEAIRRLNVELEQRVADRTAELTAANSELEAFSYSVSHDLRAPLRAIDGFTRILLDEYAAGLPDEGQEYFQLVRGGAQQMGQLVDDLLAFSRLSRQPLSRRASDPAALARQCLDELGGEQVGRRVAVTIGELPACQGDPALLKQVWLNLIANALKYTRRREQAQIEIGSRTADGETVYFVRDNGVGFDMRYSDKLFGVFQRMHRAEDYEGTGVGLAIVQRIVHRHGGRIWADAAPGQGATFSFTLGEGAP